MKCAVLMVAVMVAASAEAQQRWPVHAMDRPRPPVVNPGAETPPQPPPADAIVLFAGNGLDGWRQSGSTPARWVTRNGYMEIVPGTGSIATMRAFGDVQLHIEFATPDPPVGEGQGPGNSGVYLMSTYEVQVLDSYGNDTYPDGQAAAIYGQFPPLVNASRPPGQWQSYDIIFHRPRFAPDGSVADSARMTVLHNGVLVQDDVRLRGATVHRREAEYAPHPDRLSILLQDHEERVRYRNIWVRDLERRSMNDE